MKCYKCGTPNAVVLFSSVLCTYYKCDFYDHKHAEEMSPVGLDTGPDSDVIGYFGSSGIELTLSATHISGTTGIF